MTFFNLPSVWGELLSVNYYKPSTPDLAKNTLPEVSRARCPAALPPRNRGLISPAEISRCLSSRRRTEPSGLRELPLKQSGRASEADLPAGKAGRERSRHAGATDAWCSCEIGSASRAGSC